MNIKSPCMSIAASLLGMFTPLKGSNPTEGSAPPWKILSPLPDPVGFVGMFAGVTGGRLYAGGGAQFSDRPFWLNGTKAYSDRIYVLDQLDGNWKESPFRLPVKSAYFACASEGDAIYIAGGVDEHGRLMAEVHQLSTNGGKLEIHPLPSLPHGLGHAAAIVAEGRLYVAAGKADLDIKVASVEMWSLGLDNSARLDGWRREPDLPGSGTTLAAMGADEKGLYLFGGVEYAEDGTSLPLGNARRFDLETRNWESLPDMPAARIGPCSPSPVDSEGKFWVIGGYANIFQGPPREHPGFDAQTFFYDTATQAWENGPVIPHVLPVDRDAPSDVGPAPMLVAPCAVWQNHVVIVGGEVRQSVRTPAVLAWPLSL